MKQQTKVSGVILAGGLARRMGNQDKGLISFKGRALVSYAVDAISPIVDQLFINANRNLSAYQQFSCPVICDQTDSYDGPLAGILTAMISAEHNVLLVMPCDSPMIKTEHLLTLLKALIENQAEISVAFDGERLHPVFLAIKTDLQGSLQNYLNSGQRKIDRWLEQHKMIKVDFSKEPEIFININTLSELSELESHHD